MRFSIRNFGAIREADIDASGPITLVLGPNAAGKTLIRNAMAACLTGTYAVYGMTRNSAGRIVGPHGETATARAEHGDGSTVAITWPPGKVIPKGAPTFCDDFTVGLRTPLGLDAKAWRKFLADAVGLDEASVAPRDWTPALPVSGKQKSDVEAVVQAVQALGWDGASEQWTSNAKGSRSEWAKITGRRWGGSGDGSDEVRHWQHLDDPGTIPDDAEQRLETLEDQITAHRAAQHALPKDKRDKLRAEAAHVERLAKEHAEAVGAVQKIELTLAQLGQEHACPHCGGVVTIEDGELVKADAGPTHTAEHLLAERTKTLTHAEALMDTLSKAQHAKALLDAHPDATKPDSNLGKLQIERDVLAKAVAGRKATVAAQEVCRRARLEHAVAEFLGPDGWRRESIVKALGEPGDPDTIQGKLMAVTSAMFGGHPCQIDVNSPQLRPVAPDWRDWDILTSGMDHSSTMLRLMVAIQLIHADLDKASVALIDMVDTLDPENRKRFLGAIRKHVATPVVLFMTAGEKPAADPLAKANLGRSYWIDAGGMVVPV